MVQTTYIKVKMSESQKRRVTQLAENQGKNISAFVRERIFDVEQYIILDELKQIKKMIMINSKK